MRNIKLLFSALTVAFAVLGLTKALAYEITNPLTFLCLSISMFLTAKEYNDNKQKKSALYFLLLGLFLLVITAYNTASIIWGI